MFGCLLQEPIRLKVLWVDAKEPMRSWHLLKNHIAKGRTRALWDRHLDSSQFFRLLLRLQVFGNIILNIFMIQTLCTVMQLFKGSYFSVDAISRHFWPNSAIANGTDARIYELCFTCCKVEYKRSYIFKALPVKQ